MDSASQVDDNGTANRSARIVLREKRTSWRVLVGDRLAWWTITVGGLMVILAVVGIVVFLVRVAAPLGSSGAVLAHLNWRLEPKVVAWINADEYATMGVRVAADGAISSFHLPSGRAIAARQLDFGGDRATTTGAVLRRDDLLFGFADGSIRFARVGFDISVVTEAALPTVGATRLDDSDIVSNDGVIFSRLRENQYRRIELVTAVGASEPISDHAIVAADYRVGGTVERPTRSFVTVDAAGITRLSRADIQRNLLTGAETVRVRTATLPGLPDAAEVTAVSMTSQADAVYVAARGGMIHRFATRNFNAPMLAESRSIFEDGSDVTSLAFLNGEMALVVGGARGQVDVYFRLQREGAETADGFEMIRARSHAPQAAAIVGIDVAQRYKSLVTLDADGALWVRHSTSDQVLARLGIDASDRAQVMLMPRNDGALIVADSGAVDAFRYSFPHSTATFRTIFGKVWYEGYGEPTLTWQSSSGIDVFEPKYSLVPLIFGTLKATVYSLLFAIPIALFAAIYTSEFVHRRVRAGIKPLMEMMESLPTVVLGFVAALILAPFVETWIAAVLLAFIALPMGLMLSAFIWQTLPAHLALRLEGVPKMLIMLAVILLSLLLAYRLGPLFERALFSGDFKAWTNGDIGSGRPFLFLVLLPLGFLLIAWLFSRRMGHRFRLLLRTKDRRGAAILDGLRWLGFVAGAVALAFVAASLLTATGYDPRGGFIDTYSQRNALVVGFVMGFAIIPNIYTLAEDAMNSVPGHLRAASLAAGATPWQTARWVIIPTAMSGIFAACMIGMGRAVGETMIVVMAAGNTPVLDWNIFSGLRTLSANIAVELPEAVKDGTLYRMLFLAALTLFGMTFVINTVAEIIRQRFRKRAFQL
ncbi:MAG TPA: ABC transporter permease subunit [Xanthomonadaceae bacterium]|nr:ABC transporter permease subunit [Xanthomonadaceae bacterium]